MSNSISNYIETPFTIRLSPQTYDALIKYVDELSDGPRKTSRVAAIEYLVGKALKAEKGEPYIPLTESSAV